MFLIFAICSRIAFSFFQIVLLPYSTLLHRMTRDSCGIKIKDNIIIIDEAHNLLETINNIHSLEVTGAQVGKDQHILLIKEKYLVFSRITFKITELLK